MIEEWVTVVNWDYGWNLTERVDHWEHHRTTGMILINSTFPITGNYTVSLTRLSWLLMTKIKYL